ncbi:uncharacterized protein DNG_02189 [Cephalotrichum gorgonifer]|uniref:BZIP domain-containing protein n=1 Tax=Cephalotrichum gorgonifer TaxID=2041049 RepID=A0AAE8MSW6_9PEZI|nr:uncharacterized protein DNG_02189 [Cephalotrichum gorgonifer]
MSTSFGVVEAASRKESSSRRTLARLSSFMGAICSRCRSTEPIHRPSEPSQYSRGSYLLPTPPGEDFLSLPSDLRAFDGFNAWGAPGDLFSSEALAELDVGNFLGHSLAGDPVDQTNLFIDTNMDFASLTTLTTSDLHADPSQSSYNYHDPTFTHSQHSHSRPTASPPSTSTTSPTPSLPPFKNDSAIRKRAKEEDDDAAVKRQRNTLAARKYRQKRLDRIKELEEALEEMTRERDEFRIKLARQEAETEALKMMLKLKADR